MDSHHEWHDPLLSTDVCLIEHNNNNNSSHFTSCSYQMSNIEPDGNGRKMLGFSLSSPDLMVCTDSPDIPRAGFGDSSQFEGNSVDISLENGIDEADAKGTQKTPAVKSSLYSPDLVVCVDSPVLPRASFGDSPQLGEYKCDWNVEISLENGIDKAETRGFQKTPAVKFSSVCQVFEKELSPEGSFELAPQSTEETMHNNGDELLDGVNCIGESPVDECSLLDVTDDRILRSIIKSQREELAEVKRATEELRKENQLKGKECQDAWKSLKELQNELMRKSMHVGSLAFAIEGQVKEKSKWFSSLRDVTRKLKIMKLDQLKLLDEATAYKKCLADMDQMSSTILAAMNEQADLYQELKNKFVEGAKERKDLYNKVLELKGNIRVFCRCRPLNAEELAAGATMAIDFESAKDGELSVKSNGISKKTFKFDAVFGPQADQGDVFEDTAPFAASVLDGYNVCIFAYGQTGTGKTFTMEGVDGARGVNFRTLKELFRIIKEREKLYCYDISVSVLEVYNEQIRDLLASETHAGVATKRLEIRQVGEGVRHVPGLVEAQVNNMNEVWEVLQTGSNARAVGSTNANEHSSRSHCIHCVMVKGENLLSGECTRSKLWLVDLAGSERIGKTEVQGDRLKETQNINRSLSALGDVISALATKSPHIPFRNSKLTHLLQDSLGGDSKTLMFVQISPNETDLSETLCSLNFASRVRGIELGPPKKQFDATELLKFKQMAEKTKQDMKIKEMQVRKMEETIHSLELKMKEKDSKNKTLQEKVKELESQLLIERKLARQHVDTKIAEKYHQQQQIKQEEYQNATPARAPLTNRPLGSYKNSNEPVGSALSKEPLNLARPLIENNYKPPLPLPMNGLTELADSMEKENIPDLFEQSMLPKRTGRASLCTTVRQIPISTAARRNSLIPLPSSSSLAQCTPWKPNKNEKRESNDENCLSEQVIPEETHCDSPKVIRSGNRKISSILRRSLQKKVKLNSPIQQQLRKGGTGTEKARLSIGSRAKNAHRAVAGNSRRVGTNQQQQTRKPKERRWNAGTAGRTIL